MIHKDAVVQTIRPSSFWVQSSQNNKWDLKEKVTIKLNESIVDNMSIENAIFKNPLHTDSKEKSVGEIAADSANKTKENKK